MSLVPTRGLYLYLETLRVAFDDAIVTDDEAQILHILAQPWVSLLPIPQNAERWWPASLLHL